MAKDKAPSPEASEQATTLLTVAELAQRHGQTFHRVGKDGKLYPTVPAHDAVFKRDHLVADVLHGWSKHTKQTLEPVRLTSADYLAALEAAKASSTHAPANKRGA